MFAARRLASARPVLFRPQLVSGFHSTAPAFVKVGDKIPDVELMEGSPGNKVSIAKELKGNGLIIGTSFELALAYNPLHHIYNFIFTSNPNC